MPTITCAKCNGTGRVTWSSFRGGVCFDCNGLGKRDHQETTKQTECTCRPETWCFLPGHNFDQAFPHRER